jgi:hypothetical protein
MDASVCGVDSSVIGAPRVRFYSFSTRLTPAQEPAWRAKSSHAASTLPKERDRLARLREVTSPSQTIGSARVQYLGLARPELHIREGESIRGWQLPPCQPHAAICRKESTSRNHATTRFQLGTVGDTKGVELTSASRSRSGLRRMRGGRTSPLESNVWPAATCASNLQFFTESE